MLMKHVHKFTLPNGKSIEGAVAAAAISPMSDAIDSFCKLLRGSLITEVRSIFNEAMESELAKPQGKLANLKAKKTPSRGKGRPTKEAARSRARRDAANKRKIEALTSEIEKVKRKYEGLLPSEQFVDSIDVLSLSKEQDLYGDTQSKCSIERCARLLGSCIGELRVMEDKITNYQEVKNALDVMASATYDAVCTTGNNDVPLLTKAAIELLVTRKKLQLHPHKLTIERVYEGVEPEKSAIDTVDLSLDIQRSATYIREQALRCSHISDLDRAKHKCLEISCVKDVLDDVLSNRVDNAFLSAPMGGVYQCEINGKTYNSGSKTDGILLPLAMDALKNNKRMVVVVHRRSLAKDIYHRIIAKCDFKSQFDVHYYDEGAPDQDCKVLVVCVNSLNRFARFVNSANYVVVDECTQVMDNFGLIEDTIGVKGAYAINDILINAIGSHKTRFVALDADLESDFIKIITRDCGDDIVSKTYVIYHPETSLPPEERSRQVTFYRNDLKKTPIKNHIADLCKRRKAAKDNQSNDGKFCIAIDSLSLSVDYAAFCEKHGLKVCEVNSIHTGNEGSDASKLVSNRLKPDDFDVVVFTPSITSGVSWSTPSFKRCVLVCCGVIPASNMKQMAFRFRHTSQVDVFEASRRFDEGREPQKKKNDHREDALGYEHVGIYSSMTDHRLGLSNRSTSNQLRYLYWQFDAEGWGCSVFDIERENPVMFESDELDRELFECGVTKARVVGAEDIPLSKYLLLREQDSITSKAHYERKKFSDSTFKAVSFEGEDVAFVQSSNNDRAIKLFLGSVLQKSGENGRLLRKVMQLLGLDDWEQSLKDGEKILISRESAIEVANSLIEDAECRNVLVDLNLIRGKSNWVMTKGEPIRYNMEIISPVYGKFKGRGESELDAYNKAKSALEYRLTESMGDYSLYPLDGKDFLVKRNDVFRDSFSASMLAKLAKRCGINTKLSKDGVVLGGAKQQKLARIARARTLTERLMGSVHGGGFIREVVITSPNFVVVVSGRNRVVIGGVRSVVSEIFDGDFNIRCDRKLIACSPRQSRATVELLRSKSSESFAHSNILRANEKGYLFFDQPEFGFFELSEIESDRDNELNQFFHVSTVRELSCVILAQIPELKDVELSIETAL